jgi:hypothetical protein
MGGGKKYGLVLQSGAWHHYPHGTHPEVPLDNNAAERALRGVVVGRKNHYGSRSKRGTEVAALFYTMMETAKLSGIDARTYLRQAATQAIKKPGTITLPTELT